MKKVISIFFTLLLFVGNAWAWTEGLRDSDEALGVGKTREYKLPDGKSNPTKFHFSVASGLYWGGYDVKVRKYTSSTSYTEETRSFSGKAVQTYQEATVELSHNVIKVAIINTNDVANEYIHDVVWEGEDPAVGNCHDKYDDITGIRSGETVIVKDSKRRLPVITFDYNATKFLWFEGKIELIVNNETVWSTTEHGLKGTCSYQCTSNKNTIKIKYWGKIDVTNIKITQAKYAEIKDKSDISFGDVKTIGSTWTDKTFGTKWASYKGDVTCTSNQFSVTPTSIGSDDDCKYNDNQIITVSFNPTLPGLHTGYVYVGNQRVKVSGEAQLAKPVVTAAASGMKDITVSWNEVTGAESYNLYYYGQDTPIAEGLTTTSYHVGNLTQNTEYGFVVKAISGVGAKYDSDLSDKATAKTYSKLTIEKEGEFASYINYTISGESGKWNQSETSFAHNSKATLTATCTNSCAVFDKIKVGSNEYKTNPAVITITAPATASVYYKFKGLDKPVASVSENNSISNISIEWDVVECSDTYTIFKNGEKVASGVTESTYNFTSLSEATDYTFYVKAVRGGEESVSETISATTNTTSMLVTVNGPMGSKDVSYNITSDKWNAIEKSYAIGSTATIAVNSLPEDCVIETIIANGADISATAKFTIEKLNTVIVTYRYTGTGVAEVVDDHGNVVYGTLTDAVDKAEDGANINLLGDVEQDLVVNKHIYFNGNGHKINNLYIKKTGNVELTGDVNVVMDFGLEVTPDKAGQYDEHDKNLTILGDAYIDVQFDNVKRDKWYAFTVPFPVKMDEVKNAQTLSPLVYGTDYLFLGFDGEARAKGEKGWIRYTTPGTLEPGQLYMIGTYGSTVHRFYKVKSAALVSNAVSFDLESHASAKGGNLADWNALGNSQLFNVDANQHGTQFDEDVIAQIYQSATDSYLAVQLREHVMSVTSPIFVQRTEKCTNVSINKTDGLRYANAESALYNLQIAKEGAANFDDQMFVAASDNAPSEYVAGYALMKLGLTSSIAQIYSNMYNTNLCMIKAPYAANSVADIPLTLYAPAAGNYTLSLGKQVSDGTALYLVKDGTEIHEFNADGSYTVYLAKGTSNSYSLRLKSTDGEDITTPAAETEAGNVKVYVQEGVLVIEGLAEGGSYAVGNMIRTLYSGTSNGGDVRIPLTEKGVYWVNAGSAKVKVLNK